MVSLRVPASSANLGPGFDCLGLALGLHMTCGFELRAEGLVIEGCPAGHGGEDNLIHRAFRAAAAQLGLEAPGLRLSVRSLIPPSRGLGSSAAAIAAGIGGAWALAGRAFDREAMLALADEIEGHPDNVSAALYGGLRVAFKEEGRCRALPGRLSPALRFTALIPDFELSTRRARAAIPPVIPRADAAYNVAHALALTCALAEGDLALLRLALRDRLHQPYRLPLIEGAAGVMAAAERLGAAACVSGAGPTLLCIHLEEDFSARIAKALPSGWEALDLSVDRQGLTLL